MAESQRFLDRWLSTWLPGEFSVQLVYFIGCLLSDVASFCVVSMMSFAMCDQATAQRQTHWRLAGLIGCLVPMAVLLFSLPPQSTSDTVALYGGDWRMTAFQFFYAGYIVAVAFGFTLQCTRYLRAGPRPRRIRISLSLEMIGASITTVWGLYLVRQPQCVI